MGDACGYNVTAEMKNQKIFRVMKRSGKREGEGRFPWLSLSWGKLLPFYLFEDK